MLSQPYNFSAVLKLVNHPNIIRMEGLYESKQYLYIVMEMLTGGELFERIVGRPRYRITHLTYLLHEDFKTMHLSIWGDSDWEFS